MAVELILYSINEEERKSQKKKICKTGIKETFFQITFYLKNNWKILYLFFFFFLLLYLNLIIRSSARKWLLLTDRERRERWMWMRGREKKNWEFKGGRWLVSFLTWLCLSERTNKLKVISCFPVDAKSFIEQTKKRIPKIGNGSNCAKISTFPASSATTSNQQDGKLHTTMKEAIPNGKR